MSYRRVLTLSLLLLSCLVVAAKDKKKATQPRDVLQAHTAWVIIDPHAGMDLTDPNANRIAREDVENALARWGRLTPVTDPSQADLIIVIRKGNGKLVQPTIGNATGNNPPPVSGQRTDTGITASGRAGPPLEPTSEPHPQIEASAPDDTFAVYRGNPAYIITAANSDNPLDAPPVWRYIAKDALESPSVPAVEFRKVIAESEKALAGP
jgi:hypothetical protein